MKCSDVMNVYKGLTFQKHNSIIPWWTVKLFYVVRESICISSIKEFIT